MYARWGIVAAGILGVCTGTLLAGALEGVEAVLALSLISPDATIPPIDLRAIGTLLSWEIGGSTLDTVGSVIFLATYSRYNDISPLEHELRADIIDIVGALPGIYLARLVERTDRPASTVRYHTRVLEREEELQRASVWGNLRLFPAGTAPEGFAYYAAIRDPASARVLRVVEAHEPVTPGRLADLLGRAPSTISHHLSRFEEEQLIVRNRSGETVRVELADWVKPYSPT